MGKRPRTRRYSISTRIALWYSVSLIFLMMVVSSVITMGFIGMAHGEVDTYLKKEKERVLPFVSMKAGVPQWRGSDALFFQQPDTLTDSATYLRLLSVEGKVLYQSPNFVGRPVLPEQIPCCPREVFMSRPWGFPFIRSLYRPLFGETDAVLGWMELSVFELSSHHDMELYGFFLLIGFGLSALLAAAGGYVFAKRVLRPVAEVTEAANRINATALGVRLPIEARVRDELTDMAETFNAMLGRLEASFERERRFTSHAAHELLTPLTRMRSELELALRQSGPAAGVADLPSLLLEDVKRMSAMVERLLRLARVEAFERQRLAPVDLSALCAAQLNRFQLQADERAICLRQELDPETRVLASRVHLEEVLDNLLDNAIKYTPHGGTVTVRLKRGAHTVRLSVMDTGVGFGEQESTQLFERFYRSDEPEVQAQPGSGLGLAIVQTIVGAYGGTILAFSEGQGQGSCFEVTLPIEA